MLLKIPYPIPSTGLSIPFFLYAETSLSNGRAMVQAVSRRPLNTEAQVCVWVSPCGIRSTKVALGQVFSAFFSFPRPYHSTMALSTHIYHLGDEQQSRWQPHSIDTTSLSILSTLRKVKREVVLIADFLYFV
jgi:hypothetical protein